MYGFIQMLRFLFLQLFRLHPLHGIGTLILCKIDKSIAQLTVLIDK